MPALYRSGRNTLRQRIKTILALGLPITAGMLSQSLMNLVDTALVGHLGEITLAAAGAGSYAMLLMVSVLSGLSAAVQSRVARLQGSHQHHLSGMPVNAGLALSLWVGLPLVAIGFSLSPWIFHWIATSTDIAQEARQYFDIRLLTLPAAAFNLSFRGFWNGTNNPGQFVRILVVVHLLNALISYLLIYGKLGMPEMGIKGAAMGTFIAMYAGASLNAFYLLNQRNPSGFLKQKVRWQHQKQLLQLATPDSLQQLLFAFSLTLLFSILAQTGATSMALGHILINISLVLILPAIGLGMASTTLVSHAIGEKDEPKAYLWGRDTALTAFFVLALLNLPIGLFPEQVLSLFTSDPDMIAAGIRPLQLTGLGVTAEAAGLVLTQALLGAGDSKTVMLIRTGSQWLVLLPLYWWAVNIMGYGLVAICIVHALQRALSSLVFWIIWKKQNWLKGDWAVPKS